MSIKAIDKASIHHITSGQVIVDLQTSVKELIENSLDGGATNIEIRFKNQGLSSIEVIDNGCGIAEEDHESIGLKHHTSKLQTYGDLTSVRTFGFRGEALSSLCALSERVTICTATATTAPMGTLITLDNNGKLTKKSSVARNQGTTITISNIFSSLAVRRKELERNIKREFGKTLSLLNAYALGPCAQMPGVRLTVRQPDKGPKSIQIKTLGSPSCRDSITSLWGPKALDNIVDMDLSFEVEREKITIKRLQGQQLGGFTVQVKGLVSKFAVGCGRSGTDQQFFYVNGRPCNLSKVQKIINEVYRSFNATQSPFIVADFILPTETYDVNVSPDKRTILLHSEGNLMSSLKLALETYFAPSRSTYDLEGHTQNHSKTLTQTYLSQSIRPLRQGEVPTHHLNDSDSDAPDKYRLIEGSEEMAGSVLGSLSPSSVSVADALQSEKSIGESMEVGDEVDDDLNSNLPNVVLDPSQTYWGRRLSSAPASQPASPSFQLFFLDNNTDDDIVPTAPPRKKRKSDFGHAFGDAPNIVDLTAPLIPPAASPVPRIRTSETGAHTFLQSKASKTTQTTNTSQALRSQLAGFARIGSQYASSKKLTRPPIIDVDEEEDQLEEGDDHCDEEVMEVNVDTQNEVVDILDDAHEQEMSANQYGSRGNAARLANVDESETSPFPVSAQDNYEDDDNSQNPSTLLDEVRANLDDNSPSTTPNPSRTQIEVIKGDQSMGDICLRFDSDRVKNIWKEKAPNTQTMHSQITDVSQPAPSVPVDANVSNTDDEEGAVNALARTIEKADFENMTILGQFNLGFIVVRRQNTGPTGDNPEAHTPQGLDDLFIVDQHAADEKYNFETLQTTMRIQSQKLFRPRPLELTASDELVAIENLEILQQNGFEVEIDQEAPIGQSSRLKLTAQPISKSTVFDMKDLEEVIQLLRDRPGGQIVRCSKARAMFAMRACRKSVMIGMPLKLHQMTTVIRHMGTMNQPWNCPHGRPTMRHLLDLRSRGSQPKADIDWSSFECESI